ncbi:hypothetical protein PV02_06575 [Methanolobus chelungpuianus]|uniref:Methyltransferase domain-containing protein n=1 Tax=Methanolobus chelungpuianus TaxID=502115 RepID=A0AAE3HBU1_9EURY|nr:hypothetical protein [Methanolobus chelungpuianus]
MQKVPFVKNINDFIYYKITNRFPGSIKYWEERYTQGGNSGSGSYNKLALFKAEVLNDFCEKNNVISVIEYGCGDGNQLSLANYKLYIGLDVSKKAIGICQKKFQNDLTKSFFYYDPFYFIDNAQIFSAHLALSLDVIYHLIEDEIYESYLSNLFKSAINYVIIYSSNCEGIYNDTEHVKHRCFTKWIEVNKPDWILISHLVNKYPFDSTNEKETSFADFYIYKKTNKEGKND